MRTSFAALLTLLILCLASEARAEPTEESLAEESLAEEYLAEIRPLLETKCSACHGALKQEAGLRLDAGQLILAGGDSGPVVEPGDPDASLLLERVAAEDAADRMPPEGEGEALNPEQLELVKRWIRQGAPFPDDEPIPAHPREHWAYQVPERPEVPVPADPAWAANPIDAFLAEQYQQSGVTPARPADPATLLRRLHLDLAGLPPTREELLAFLAADSTVAYPQAVDRLLNSPHYGERWGRHWMDVWRYSDWDGYKNQLRGSQRHIWRWRDWIVESLNEDKGYDQMIREMLAGDELAPANPDVLRATGFLARNYHNKNRDIWLDATVEHTAKAFLGMTINCARCHDHKFDPLAQTEYYALRAVFEPHHVRTQRVPGEANLLRDGLPRVFDAEPDAETYLYLRGNEKHPDKENPIEPGVPAIFGRPLEIAPVDLPPVAVFPALLPHVEQETLAAAERKLASAEKQHAEKRAELEAGQDEGQGEEQDAGQGEAESESSSPAAVPKELELSEQRVLAARAQLASLRARFAADKAKYQQQASGEAVEPLARAAADAERQANLAAARLELLEARQALATAEASDESDEKKKQAAVKKAADAVKAADKKLQEADKALAKTDLQYTSVGEAYPARSTGRRTALARWIADSRNPLTARVAVNQIWMRHFGEPLVENVFDFGLRSPRPVHARLLDWLSVELMENDWQMKHLHRLIVNSRAYQLASSDSEVAAANQQRDPDNRLFWRAHVRRLDAEVVRDSVLHVAGSLDATFGGPDIDYEEGEKVPRRSIYFRHAYEKQMTMLVLFDAAGPAECYRRSESIVPQQALALANSALSRDQARKLARRLWRQAGESTDESADTQRQFIEAAFNQVLTRFPTEQELAACRQFLAAQSSTLAKPAALNEAGGTVEATLPASDDPDERARESLVHVLLNHNDFVTVR